MLEIYLPTKKTKTNKQTENIRTLTKHRYDITIGKSIFEFQISNKHKITNILLKNIIEINLVETC